MRTAIQSLKDRFDYSQNPEKTLDGSLIRSYECDPLTADSEFLLSKARYKSITGREQKRDADVQDLKHMRYSTGSSKCTCPKRCWRLCPIMMPMRCTGRDMIF